MSSPKLWAGSVNFSRSRAAALLTHLDHGQVPPLFVLATSSQLLCEPSWHRKARLPVLILDSLLYVATNQ